MAEHPPKMKALFAEFVDSSFEHAMAPEHRKLFMRVFMGGASAAMNGQQIVGRSQIEAEILAYGQTINQPDEGQWSEET